MRLVEFIPFRLTETADIFSIKIDGKETTELQEFFITFKNIKQANLQSDFEQVIKSLAGIGEHGVKESFFRPEGKISDRVCAIPLFSSASKNKSGTLRLYCLRISDKLLIVGGGGIKTTQTYNEDENLSRHVQTLQSIDRELSKIESEGQDLSKAIYNLTIQID